ncbi:hypothetical protein ACX84U_20435, partial [Burkholderia pseudomallei]
MSAVIARRGFRPTVRRDAPIVRRPRASPHRARASPLFRVLMRAHPATRPRPNSGAPGVGASLSKNSIAAAGRCAGAAAASERMPACADSSRDKPA